MSNPYVITVDGVEYQDTDGALARLQHQAGLMRKAEATLARRRRDVRSAALAAFDAGATVVEMHRVAGVSRSTLTDWIRART